MEGNAASESLYRTPIIGCLERFWLQLKSMGARFLRGLHAPRQAKQATLADQARRIESLEAEVDALRSERALSDARMKESIDAIEVGATVPAEPSPSPSTGRVVESYYRARYYRIVVISAR